MPDIYRIRTLLVFSISVRLSILILGQISDVLIPDYDSSNPSKPFRNWDGVYFSNIAETGTYKFEMFHAFFPGFPLLSRYLFHLSPVLISNASFVLSVYVFFQLTMIVFKKKEKFAFLSSYVYSVTPAGIFMSSCYTESLFSLLSLTSMLVIVRSTRNFTKRSSVLSVIITAVLIGCTSSVRSNGIVLCGFLVYHLLCFPSFLMLVMTVLCCFVGCAGFVGFQIYAFFQFCGSQNEEDVMNNHPWCNKSIPLLYSYVQNEYWDVGFLRYYQIKQIPNFILASPVIAISFALIWVYFAANKPRFMTFGILEKYKTSQISSKKTNFAIFGDSQITVFVYYHLGMLLSVIFTMHIQVLTRFFSSFPTLYWFIADLFQQKNSNLVKFRKLYIFYVLVFNIIGTILFTNFYPWT